MTDTQEPQNLQADPEVIDAEVVSEETIVPVETADQTTVLSSLDELIKSHIASIDRLSEEKKKLADMLADGFNNDQTFKEASDKVKEASKVKAQARAQIMNRPGVLEIANKLKSVNAEVKEKQMSLSDYLLEYQRLADGVNEIEGYDGEVREIVHVAKLVKKSKPQK